jgi:hypothetical protein
MSLRLSWSLCVRKSGCASSLPFTMGRSSAVYCTPSGPVKVGISRLSVFPTVGSSGRTQGSPPSSTVLPPSSVRQYSDTWSAPSPGICCSPTTGKPTAVPARLAIPPTAPLAYSFTMSTPVEVK